jgi:hypothetical protein
VEQLPPPVLVDRVELAVVVEGLVFKDRQQGPAERAALSFIGKADLKMFKHK